MRKNHKSKNGGSSIGRERSPYLTLLFNEGEKTKRTREREKGRKKEIEKDKERESERRF